MLAPYRWLVLIHVLAILLLLLLHGGVVIVAYMLRNERDRGRVAALMDISKATFDSGTPIGKIFWIDLLVVAFSGIGLMVWGGHWHFGWSWLSIVLFFAVVAAMGSLGSGPMRDIRRAAGIPYVTRQGMGRPTWHEAEPPDAGRMEAAIASLRPNTLSLIGLGGFAVLAWLMLFKPF